MKSVIQHLRLHFSLFLMPVFWFAFSQVNTPNLAKALWAFIILHLIIYPASNAYNSYFDKDEGPIGGIEKPMPVNIQLFYTANLLDLIGVILAFLFCSNAFCLAIIIYILISKAYSHPIIRLKKYPLLSWMVVGFFQGAFVYLAVYQLISVEETVFFNKTAKLPAMLASCNLWAFYPITQIYQHEADAARGDITLSLKLGIRGTFIFTGLLFMVSTIGFYYFFSERNVLLPTQFIIYIGCMLPSLIFFNIWVLKTWKKTEEANFKNTMVLNTLGAFCLNLFFIILILTKNNLF